MTKEIKPYELKLDEVFQCGLCRNMLIVRYGARECDPIVCGGCGTVFAYYEHSLILLDTNALKIIQEDAPPEIFQAIVDKTTDACKQLRKDN